VTAAPESLASNAGVNAFELVKHPTGLDHGNPEFRSALTFTHPGFGGLLGKGLVRENPDPNLTTTLHVTGQGDTTSLNLAVGQLIARVGATELDVNVGVGQASVTAARIDTGHIVASAGVGSATVHGANRSDSQRAFVSENVDGFGEGEFNIEVNVGVGEASVFLVDET